MKCGKTGMGNGPIILLAVISLLSFSWMALGFTLADLWFDLECGGWDEISSVMSGTSKSSLILKPSVKPETK